jgi:YegS/Rv2252/BmrU family lipid kinase
MQDKRALLVFNPEAGDTGASALQLSEMISLMQLWHIIPEVHIIGGDSRLSEVVGRALRHGVRLVVAAGGDGTIESVAQAVMGSRATLGIIPKGTRNNLALSLGIPLNMAEAVELLRHGRAVSIDVGRAACGAESLWFLETSSIGLLPALYPAADDIQHGNLTRITELLSTLVSYQPASMRLTLDHGQQVDTQGYLALVANAPYFGVNIQVSSRVSFQDAWLDVFVFSNLTKLELIGYAAAQITTGGAEDPRILHYRVKHVMIETVPPMQVTADGTPLGEGPLLAEIYPRSLRVMAGRAAARGPEEMA